MKRVYKTFRQVNPEAASMWMYGKNEKTPDTIGAFSKDKAYFKCRKGHEFVKTVLSMTDKKGRNTGCPYCRRLWPIKGETDFQTICPEGAAMWDYGKNDTMPYEYLPCSEHKAYFTCVKGHTKLRSVHNVTRAPSCPVCFARGNNLFYTHPEIEKFWAGGADPKKTSKTSRSRIKLACPACNYKWEWMTVTFHENPMCPHCGYDGESLKPENAAYVKERFHITTLYDKHPWLVGVWDESNEKDCYSIRISSNKKVRLRCEKGHVIEICPYTIGDRLYCRYCDISKLGIVVHGLNDLFSRCPEAKEMWRDKSIDPGTVTVNSRQIAYFRCPDCGYEFKKKISAFSANPNCPRCRRRAGSFAVNAPGKMKYWDYDRMEYDPEMVSVSSKKIGFWKCPDCNNTWQRRFKYMVCIADEKACPYCSDTLKLPDTYPEVIKEWDILSNYFFLQPQEVTALSSEVVWWKCQKKGHRYRMSVKRKIEYENRGLVSCPMCKGLLTQNREGG